MPSTYEIIICLIALIICTITDIKSTTIYPVVPLLLVLAGLFTPNKDLQNNIYCALIGFVPLFVLNRFGNGGDGDALLCGAIGFSMPIKFGISVFFLAYVLYAIVLLIAVIITKNKKMQLPYVPFITSSYIIILIMQVYGGAI